MDTLEAVIGRHPDAWCDALLQARSGWVQGSLSYSDTRFLFKTAFNARTSLVVEIGTGSGFSTTVLCHALNFAHKAGRIGGDFQVVSYDISRTVYSEPSRRVGDATREQLPPELLEHVTFRNPASAADLRQHHGLGEIRLLFIDANHGHPWPTLDLLAALDGLDPRATIVLHDINLPLLHQEHQVWGAKYLFDGLDVEKDIPRDVAIPNIGSIVVPDEKEQLRGRLHGILRAHEWQADVSNEYLIRLGIRP
jgi:predicted O-methyltransferase YrrM